MKISHTLAHRALFATSLSYVIVILDTSIVNVALPSIAQNLNSSLSGLQWVVNAYTLTFAGLLLSGGAMGDKLGAKTIYLSGLLLFAAASLMCGLSASLPVLIVARVLQGVGASLLVPSSLALINQAFPQAAGRAKAIAVWAGCGGLAMAAGPLLGGIMIQWLGWRSIFLLNVPVALLGIVLAMRIPSAPRLGQKRALDLAGQCWVILALGMSVAVLIQVSQRGWHDSLIRFGAVIALIAWGCFIATEKHHREPMVPPGLFRAPLFTASVMVSLLSGLVFYGLLFLMSLYFQQIRGWSPLYTGLGFLPLTVFVTAGSFMSGKVNQRVGPHGLIAGCCALYAIGFTGLFSMSHTVPYWRIALFFPALGLAAGMITPVATSCLMSHVPAAQAGIGAGILNAGRQTGSALGVAIFGGLMSAFPSLTEGIHIAVIAGIIFSLLAGAIWILLVMRSSPASAR